MSDLNFLQGLFDVFPFASDDTEAQSAIWSTIARVLTHIQEREMSPLNFQFLVSILASKLDLIEDDLLARPLDHLEHKIEGTQTDARLIAVSFNMCVFHNLVLHILKLPITLFVPLTSLIDEKNFQYLDPLEIFG